MSVFSWNCTDGNHKNSRFVKRFECHATKLVAYYISDKNYIGNLTDFSNEYLPLKNNYGIYFLLGDGEPDINKPTIYVGQASKRTNSKGLDRIKEHSNMNSKDKYKNKWNQVIFVTSTDNSWSTGLLDTLEFIFISSFKGSNKYESLNDRPGQFGNILEKDYITELTAISELISMPMFDYRISESDTKEILRSVYDYLVKEIHSIRDEVRAEYKQDYYNKYDIEIRNKLAYIENVERYNNFKSIVNFAQERFISEDRIYYGSYKEIITPDEIAKQMIYNIPPEEFNSKAKFIDIACKSGVFLKWFIIRYMSDEDALHINHEAEFKDKHKRLKHLIENQLYAICLSDHGYLVSNHVVMELVQKYEGEIYSKDFSKNTFDMIVSLPNIITIDAYKMFVNKHKNISGNPHEMLIANIKNKLGLELKDGEELKFDIVMGNPPYNKGEDIDFIDFAYKISSKYTCMIVPAKWQTAKKDHIIKSSMSYGSFRNAYQKHIRDVIFYPCCQDIFNIYQPDGISIILMDKQCHETCKIENVCKDIKVFNSTENRTLNNRASLLNIGNEIIEFMGDYPKFKFNSIEGNMSYEVWTNTQPSGYDWYATKKPRYVLCPSRIIKKCEGETCEVGAAQITFESNDLLECKSFMSYINSKFARFFLMANISRLTGMLNDDCFRFVPAPPFGLNHIYTDEELYRHFNLKSEYIDVIESTIKSRE